MMSCPPPTVDPFPCGSPAAPASASVRRADNYHSDHVEGAVVPNSTPNNENKNKGEFEKSSPCPSSPTKVVGVPLLLHNDVKISSYLPLPPPQQEYKEPGAAAMRLCARFFRLAIYSIVVSIISATLYSTFWDLYYAAMTTPGVNQAAAERLGCAQIGVIPEVKVPHSGGDEERKGKRLVFIGDVHGMYDELMDLLTALSYTPARDHLVFTGDLVTRGPDSLKVLDFACNSGAQCVRGNQDDRVLLHYRQQHTTGSVPTPASNSSSKELVEGREIAAAMTQEQAEWLEACPLILTAEDVSGLGNVAVVHAGLVHGIELEQQDLSSVMNMRSINMRFKVPSHKASDGVHWADLWNAREKLSPVPLTVIYGHFASKGLDLRQCTKGLDSDCARGGRLTALLAEGGDKTEIVSVECRRKSKESG